MGLSIKQPYISKHKTDCLGLKPDYRPQTALEAEQAEGRELVVPSSNEVVAWVPVEAQSRARSRLIEGLDKIEVQIEKTPTAAYYQVRLEYIKEIIKEAEKGGGALSDRMKNYMEEVKSRKREVTRTVTMKETTVTLDDPTITVIDAESGESAR